ncbi:MAG: sugar ABC transporter substrate-binding protein [Treponema sp.]|nr:sugar ABC transporter substrate-binding protein [Treponema sp.]
MKKLVKAVVVGMIVSALCGSLFSCKKKDAGTAGSDTIRVAMVLKTLSSQYWQLVAAGAKDAAAKNNVDLILLGPPSEDAVEQQVNMLLDVLTQNPAVLCVSPSQPPTVVNALNQAKSKNIPVILVDTPMPDGYTDYATFIGTTNKVAGKQGGELLVKTLAAGSNVFLIEGAPGNPTMTDRVDGAEEVLRAGNMTIVGRQPAYSDRERAYTVTQNALKANPNIDAVFAGNDESALGALRALQQAGKSNTKVIGFDGTSDALNSILEDGMFASIAQKPYDMGRLAVEKAIELTAGKTIEKRIDSGTDVVTKENAQTLLDFVSSVGK